MARLRKRIGILVSFTIMGLGITLSSGFDTVLAKETNVVGPGGFHTITQPGKYQVVGTVEGIYVLASSVHIQLKGEVVCDPTEATSTGITIAADRNVHIHGSLKGSVSECLFGIRIIKGKNHHINNVVVTNNRAAGIKLLEVNAGGYNHINGNTSSNNGSFGIAVLSDRNHINGNTALNNNTSAGFGTDLSDEYANCGNNRWNGNVFDTSRAGGVDDPKPRCI